MKIRIKALSPVHIGSGEEITPLEYLFHDGKFIRLDMDGLFKDPEFQPFMDKFLQSARTQRYIGNLLPRDLLLKHPLYSIEVSSSARNSNPVNVRSHIKSAGRVYLPGSSLKGSLLSGVIYKIAIRRQIRDLREYEELLSRVLSEISLKGMGKFSRWLSVEDSDLLSPEETLELSLVERVGAGGRRGVTFLCETIKKDTLFQSEIKTSLDSFYRFGKLSEEEILKMADEFYRKVYEKERKSRVPSRLPSCSSEKYLLRIGHGSSCLSTSLLLLAEELGIRDYYILRPRIRGRQLSPIRVGEEPSTRELVKPDISIGWVEVEKC